MKCAVCRQLAHISDISYVCTKASKMEGEEDDLRVVVSNVFNFKVKRIKKSDLLLLLKINWNVDLSHICFSLKCYSNAMFTLDVCVCAFVNVTVKPKDGFRPILCICVCFSIDTILNFDGNVDANVKCEHSISVSLLFLIRKVDISYIVTIFKQKLVHRGTIRPKWRVL